MAWLDGYERVPNARGEGSAYADRSYYPYRSVILLHMTVSYGASRSYIAGHSVPPHFWANPYNGDKFQTVRADRAAFALYQPQYGYHWVNKHTYLLQTELIGVPVVSQATYTDDQCRWIAEHVVVPQARWLASIGEPVDLTRVRYHTNTSGSASEYWSGRMSEQEMADFHGLMAHIDAWGNDHWDCSAERVDLIALYARELLGDVSFPPASTSSRREPVSIPATLRPGTQWTYDLELIAEGEQVPTQAGNGPKIVASTLVVRQAAVDGVEANTLIVWGSGKAQVGRKVGGAGQVERFPCAHTGLASVVSDRPLVVRGEQYAA